MATVLDDVYPHGGDPIPPLSLWQIIQIVPLLLALRASLPAYTPVPRDVIHNHSFCGRARSLPQERRAFVAPRGVHRGGTISVAGADMDRRGAQVRVRGDDCTGVCRLGTQEPRRDHHGRAS
jgi:hypothetical protein